MTDRAFVAHCRKAAVPAEVFWREVAEDNAAARARLSPEKREAEDRVSEQFK